MRKILLASTALVALTSVSAMAADVTISGGASLIYKTDDNNEPANGDSGSASAMSSETDINITFSATTDSGISTTLNAGFDESSNTDDATATISGDFGTIKIIPSSGGTDHNYVASMDEKYDKAGEGTGGEAFGLAGATGESIGYQFPTLVENLTIAVQHSNEDTSESFGYGVSYDAGIATVSYATMQTNTDDYKSVGVAGSLAGISFGVEQNKIEGEGNSDDEATLWGVSYSIDAITLAYEKGDAKNESGDVEDYAQFAVSYAIAPGITAIMTSSEVTDSDGANAADVEELELQLKLSF